MVRNMLHKKLLRDMRRSAMQFFALIVLCVLGTLIFSGIDGISRMIGATNAKFFTENNLADYWVSLGSADRDALAKVRAVDGVNAACARFSLEMDADLPGEPGMNVTAYDGPMDINRPLIAEGAALDVNDRRGCLLQDGFAREHGLSVGDSITVKLNALEVTYTVRGIAFSPEFISVSDGVVSDPTTYGFMLVNACSMPSMPLTQIVVDAADDADPTSVRAGIAEALPQAFIMDRRAHRSTALVEDYAVMFHNIAIVFPLAAYAVAALIVMTTLTRMIENERMHIGTLQALGFSARRIERHYLSYAVLPSLVGSVLGVLAGHAAIPPLMWHLLIGQNEYPYRISPPVSLPAWCIAALTVVMSLAICLITYRKAIRESTAALMRPKPPKDGKRILLERITCFWQRLSFNGKMVVRNLMRNKMRTIMSLVGILCCNALLIASMGLQDSVTNTVYDHYGKTLGYDVRANLTGDAGLAEAYETHLKAGLTECIMETSLSITAGDTSRTTLLTILKDGQQMLHLGPGETLLDIPTGTVAVTEKLAEALGVKPGDVLTCQLAADKRTFTTEVSALAVSNLSQGIYMTRSTWEGLRKGAFTPTAILIKEPSATCLSLLSDMDEVSSTDLASEQIEEALMSLDLISAIFVILMLLALALAFVICYNMGLMNFSERTREYATLKVLGYHQKEIRKLILHENTIITLLAIALSIVPGINFTGVILLVSETEAMRYAVHVAVQNIALCCAITWLFSIFIQRLLVRKVRSIVMVEALKSVE